MSNLIIDTPSRHVYIGDGSTRVFPIPTYIQGDDWIRIEINGIHVIDRRQWDIVNNSIIFVTAPEAEATINVLVASSIEALTQLGSTSAISIVAENITNVNLVAQNMEDIQNASDNAISAKLDSYIAESHRLTANSYAVEPEDTYVKIYTSNGDGTFTTTDTADYSSLHWERKAYAKSKISKNYLWQGLFGTRRSSVFGCKNFRIPCYDGWTIATHTGVNANNFYTVKTIKGVKIIRVAGSIVSDTVSLVANLPKKLSKELVGQGCFIKTKINKGIGYNGDVFLTVNASNYLEQPITNNIGTYTNGNNIIKNIKLDETENIIPCLISEIYEQVAININISFSGSSSENDYVEIEYVGLGLNNFFDVKKVDKDISKKYIAMSYSDGMQIGSATLEGSISKVANTATTPTNKVIHTQDIDLEWAITATCYDTLGNELEMYDANDSVSKYAMIDNLSNKGFTIRNNQDITVGNKVLFHYVAEGVL